MKLTLASLSVALCQALVASTSAWACDPCSLYNASRMQGLVPGTFSLAVSNQLTNFDRPTTNQDNSIKNGEVVREFSTTQISASYDFNQAWGLQLNVPVINRIFDDVSNYRYKKESQTGLGDISVIGRYSFLNLREADWSVIAGISGGVKLPTGDTGSLGEVSSEEEGDVGATRLRHHPVPSASGGRALVMGSGSVDYILGSNLFARYQRALFLTDIQYSIRTEGSFNYEFADDFIWSTGPGYYLFIDDHNFAALRLSLTGEFKHADQLSGERVAGSSFSNFYLGPEVLFSISEGISGQAGMDMRTTGEDAGSIVVPEMRFRSAIAFRF